MRHRFEKNEKYYKSGFKNCNIDDYDLIQPGFKEHDEHESEGKFAKEIQKRFCPDIGENEKQYFVKNQYTNLKERISFMIEISICQNDKECKSTELIDHLLENIYFTMYVAHGRVELFNQDDLHESSPIKLIDRFHSQFALNRK